MTGKRQAPAKSGHDEEGRMPGQLILAGDVAMGANQLAAGSGRTTAPRTMINALTKGAAATVILRQAWFDASWGLVGVVGMMACARCGLDAVMSSGGAI